MLNRSRSAESSVIRESTFPCNDQNMPRQPNHEIKTTPLDATCESFSESGLRTQIGTKQVKFVHCKCKYRKLT